MNMEMVMYLFKCVYLVDETMFRNPLVVLETILHFTKAKKIIDNTNYNIKYVGLVDGEHFSLKDHKYIFEVISYVNKNELLDYFKKNSTTSETFEVLWKKYFKEL